MKIITKIFISLFALLSAAVLALFAWYFLATKDSVLSDEKLAISFSSVSIYDKSGGLMQETSCGGKRETVALSDLPSHLPNAFVAVEDKRFYTHRGLEYGRMVKAAVKNLAARSFVEGASTISQQLVKNTHLSGEKTMKRKLNEIKLTRELEKKYSKEQILELYFNSIYFGHSSFGLAHAAKFYFGKPAANLLPAESATLAALVKSPNRYSPFRDAEKCLSRRNFVLTLMHEQKYLSAKELENAINTPLPTTPHEEEGFHPYLALVNRELSEIFPDAEGEQMRNLSVYTAFSPTLQEQLKGLSATENDCTYLIRENETNTLLAFYSTCGKLARLPASTIKPLLVYAPAIEEGELCPATPILDEAVNFNGYAPSNYSGTLHGYVSARYALAHSVNIPAVKILNSFGVERAVKYLEKMGLSVSKEDYSLALALGGMKNGFSLTSLADAYATLSSNGYYSTSRTITRILDENGKEIYSATQNKTRVFSEDTCSLVNDMLQTAVKEGTAKKLNALPFAVYAKTGTGGTEKGNTDAYTVGYTSHHTVAVWFGNADNTPILQTGGGEPANVTMKIFRTLYNGSAPNPLPLSSNVEQISLDKDEYENNHKLCIADDNAPVNAVTYELFSRNNLPSEKSTRFSVPTIEMPHITVKNGAVLIELCHAEYYEYVIKREFKGHISTIYRGKYKKSVTDNSVTQGNSYTYSVQPFYKNYAGTEVFLPTIRIPDSSPPSDDWWN